MKKTIAFLLSVLCLFSIFPYAVATQNNCLYLVVEYPEGLFKQKYDVDIYFGDEFIKTLKYGELFSTVIENLDSGTYSLSLYKADNKAITITKPIYIDQDSTISFEVDSKKKSVEISLWKQISGIESSRITVPDLEYVYLNTAESSLKQLGFLDIQFVSENEGSINSKSNWLVISQNHTKGSVLKSTDSIILTCKKIDTFLAETFDNQRLPAALKEAEKLNLSVSYKDYLTGDSLKRSNFILSDDWKVAASKSGSNSNREVILSILFEGEAIMPNLINMRLKDAIELLHDFHFSNIEYSSWDGSKISNLNDWKVVEQGIPFGTTCNTTDFLQLNCITTEKGDEQVKSNSPENQYSFSEVYEDTTIVHGVRGTTKGYRHRIYFIDEENDIFIELIATDNRNLKDEFKYSIYRIESIENNMITVISKKYGDYSYFKLGKDGEGSYLRWYYENDDGKMVDGSTKYREKNSDSCFKYLKESGFFDSYPLPQKIKWN